jgi:hypothetical protein
MFILGVGYNYSCSDTVIIGICFVGLVITIYVYYVVLQKVIL